MDESYPGLETSEAVNAIIDEKKEGMKRRPKPIDSNSGST